MPLSEIFVHVFPGLGDPRDPGVQELEGVYADDREHSRHLVRTESLPHDVIHEENLGFRVVDQVMDIPRLEFVQDRDHDRSVGDGGQIADSPVHLVAGADRDLVPLVEEALLEGYVKLLYSSCHIPVAEADALVIRKCLPVPVLPETLFKEFVDRLELKLSHIIFFFIVLT